MQKRLQRRLNTLNVSVWQYLEDESNHPGLHLTADVTGCEVLLRVIAGIRSEAPGTDERCCCVL